MSGIVHTVTTAPRRRTVAAALIAIGLAFSLTQVGSGAEILDPLPYSRGYLLTGNYVVSGVDLTEQQNPPDSNGMSTGTIHISKCTPTVTTNCVPADADIVAAYMYWEAIIPTATPSLAGGVTFRGEEILLNDVMGVKASSQELTGSTASCWSSGSPLTMVQFRADVLRFLPIRLDKDNNPTGKRLVTDEDLLQHGLPLHQVTLPTRTGNQIPESAGASLLLVYRDPAEVLRKIVIFDGIHIQASVADTMTQRLRGFYKSAATPSAQVTQIIASGQPNNNERVYFDRGATASTNTPISPVDPIMSGSSSQRGWSNLTYDVSLLMSPASNFMDFGETVTTNVTHTPAGSGYDCLTWGAIIFSTAVADEDHDGLPDGLEDSSAGLKDPPSTEFPTGQPLPNLHAMGTVDNPVGSDDQDVFVEINAMETTTDKDHGLSPRAPYPGETTGTKEVHAHTHMPSPEVLAMIGDAYWTRGGIRVHFDVGDIEDYQARGQIEHTYLVDNVEHTDWVDDYASDVANKYLVPIGATGGEIVDERACNASLATCQFPDYPGTVSWKLGLQLYRDAPVANDGTELTSNTPPSNWNGRRRFDRNRKGLVHYVLYAHYRGRPRSVFPCLDTSPPAPDEPKNYPTGSTSCLGHGPHLKNNPDFHIPSSASGVADLPGGNALVTLGFWDDFVGRPFVQGSTTFHELGHNYDLWHGGAPAIWGNKFPVATATSTTIAPNCKPNYLSSMSYLFQVHGLFKDDDSIHFDFSGETSSQAPPQGPLSESTPENDAPFSPTPNPPYRPAWYAPFESELAASLGAPEAKRYCHGEAFGVNPHMARVYTDSAASIDWNGDGNDDQGDITQANPDQDINLDHALNTTMASYSDWGRLRLDQISAGRNAVRFQDGDFSEFGSGDFVEFGSGDFIDFGSGDFIDFGSGDFIDFGSGDFIDFGSGAIFDEDSGDFSDFGSGDFIDFGSGDFIDFGSGDFLEFGSGSERQELSFEHAKDLMRTPPYSLKGCVITENAAENCSTAPKYDANHHRSRISWKTPTFGRVALNQIFRKRGAETSLFPFPTLPTGTSVDAFFIDPEQLPDGQDFTYRVRARFDDSVFSPFSKTVTQAARNDAPELNVVNGLLDTYTVVRNRTLNVTNPGPGTGIVGVRANDRDPDSPTSLILVQLATPPTNGTLTLNANGTFTYTPQSGFVGVDSFWYTATNGMWSVDPTVPMNNVNEIPAPVQVVINVTPQK